MFYNPPEMEEGLLSCHGRLLIPSITKASKASGGGGGFSLVELMVVLVIIALLASLVSINVQGYLDSARQRKAMADLAILHNQVKAYYADHGRYPTTSEGLEALTPKYVELLSKDPWGRAYEYEQPGRERPFDIICFGADGREGGDESDRDLTNWTINDPEDDS